MRFMFSILIVAPLLTASSSLAQNSSEGSIAKVRAEAVQAEAEARRLSAAAGEARGEAARSAADRLAAAAAITAAEARITEMDAGLAARDALVSANAARLAEKQAPVAALVAGLVNLGRRPPLVSLADDHDLTQMVRMRALLDVAVPRIRANSAALAAELAASRRLADNARQARQQVAAARADLAKRQQAFAALEARSLDRAARLDSGALVADDRMLVASEGVATLGNQWEREQPAADWRENWPCCPAHRPAFHRRFASTTAALCIHSTGRCAGDPRARPSQRQRHSCTRHHFRCPRRHANSRSGRRQPGIRRPLSPP